MTDWHEPELMNGWTNDRPRIVPIGQMLERLDGLTIYGPVYSLPPGYRPKRTSTRRGLLFGQLRRRS